MKHLEITTLTRALVPCLAAATLIGGCATKGFVRQENETTRTEIDTQLSELSGAIEAVQSDVDLLEGTVEEQGKKIEELSLTSREALERALAAGKLAEGKFLYETLLNDDRVPFEFERATLSAAARDELDQFAAQIREHNKDVYVEIQGHTDSSGDEAYNLTLGEQRAAAVRRYLSLEQSLPLHRMAIISYGESVPLQDNSTREGRAQNRRVSLVVLQ